jgi:hypothetical protein
VALLFTKTCGQALAPALGALDPRLPEDVTARSPLSTPWRFLEKALEDFMEMELIAP